VNDCEAIKAAETNSSLAVRCARKDLTDGIEIVQLLAPTLHDHFEISVLEQQQMFGAL
jgi:hypothetical protein